MITLWYKMRGPPVLQRGAIEYKIPYWLCYVSPSEQCPNLLLLVASLTTNCLILRKQKMENAVQLSVPLDVEIDTGLNWLQAH